MSVRQLTTEQIMDAYVKGLITLAEARAMLGFPTRAAK
jgi:hypothetical protein